jgi:tetratricopeptide (TPR) repeat protein
VLIRLYLLCLNLVAFSAFSATPQQQASSDWIGAEQCSGCHAPEFEAWKDSHHDLAMQLPTAQTVLGNFDDSKFQYAGITTQFFRREDGYWIRTDGADGKLQDFKVQYVFGVAPLQQYLLELSQGRLQALTIAWDSRPERDGGQRWFHLYPDEQITAGDPLHWTGPYQNWNGRCAECHSTNLQKNFDLQQQTFSTTWTELNVACESCHGPGSSHRELARTGALSKSIDKGFPTKLDESGSWKFPPGQSIARRSPPLAKSQQIESCGRCHSRRGNLGEYLYGHELLDTHRVSLLEEPLYHVDGQIRDEVYVYGSFLQSKMHQAGVVCSNCHEPHSLKLRAPGNGVCAQCHRADVYDATEHHHHAPASDGSQCANCHMPETTYMVVDPRRDHSMRIPRPDLSVVAGTPNACNQCHSEKTAQWALDSLREWGTQFTNTGTHPARLLQLARTGDVRAVPGLQELASDPQAPAIWRATAIVQLGAYANREAYDTARQLLQSDDAILRLGAVRALEFLPPQQLLNLLTPLLWDSSAAVRLEVARLLAATSLEQIQPAQARALQELFDEYLQTLAQNSDMPEVQVQLGIFFSARQSWQAAEKAYRRALQLNPQMLAAALNLADLYRTLQREDEARALLLQAIAIAPDQGVPAHALGLLETRMGNTEEALRYLARAAELEQAGFRHRYVYAIALHDSGQGSASIDTLKALLRVTPDNPDVLIALVTYCRESNRVAEAKRYAGRLRTLSPDDPNVQRLYDSL